MTRLGIVTGLPREAEILHGTPALVRCDGPGPDNARRAAQALIVAGADALLSFGVAGGLDPSLRPGDLVVATEAIAPDGTRYPTDPAWRTRIAGHGGAILGRDSPVASVAEKRRLFAATGAIAVDLESASIAAAAATAGVGFLAVRAIADAADRAIPQAALAALRPDGGVDYLALAARPGDWWRLMELARDWRRARQALSDVALGLSRRGLL